MLERPVQFFSEGVRIAATLRLPQGASKRPAVICCQGFSLTREVWVPGYAKAFTDEGFVTLMLDYRHFGESGGEPRCRLLPEQQAKDVRAGLTFLSTLDEVDATRLGLFGVSLGASVALQAAGTDARVKAVISVAGPGDLERVWSGLPDFPRFRAKVDAAHAKFVTTGEATYVGVPKLLAADPDTCALIVRDAPKHATWRPEVTFESLHELFAFKPEDVAGRVRGASLFIYPAADALVSKSEVVSMYAKASEPKALLALEGLKHHEVYGDGAGFEPVRSASVAFLKQHLS